MIANRHFVLFLAFLPCVTSTSKTGKRHPDEIEDTRDRLVPTAGSQISKTERLQSRSTAAMELLRRKEEGGLLFSDYTVSEAVYTQPPGPRAVSGVWPVTTTRRTTARVNQTAVSVWADVHGLSHTETSSVDGSPSTTLPDKTSA
ncbi:hypothetical protein BaRGS_00030139, partial [Batillaria attramentaria]